MPKLNTTVKSIRIDNDVLRRIEGDLGGRSINGWFNEKIPSLFGTTSEIIAEDDLRELESMSMFMGGSVSKMIHLFTVAMSEGAIIYDGERYIGEAPINLDKFFDKCKEMSIDPQKAIDKIVKEMR